MIIYLDVVFFENFIMNMSIIFSEALLLNQFNSFFRKILATLIASAYYILTLIAPKISYFQIICGIIVMLISFGFCGLKKLVKQLLLFYFISFLFAGISFGIMCFINQGKISIFNGVVVGNFDIFKIFLSGGIGVVLLIIFLKRKRGHILKSANICIDGNLAKVKLLLDTGNLLREPYTNKPVVIVEKKALKGILDEDMFINFNNIISEKYDLPIGMFLIPYRSIGNKASFLLGIKPDFIEIKEDKKKLFDVVIGVCDENISENGAYSGIFGLDLLNEGVCEV